VQPNPSFEARPNIKTQAPQGGAGYHPPCWAWVLLSASASIQTLGCTPLLFIMFTLHCTRKLLNRGAPKLLPVAAAPTTVLGDWYANIVFTRPEQVVVCLSERTLLPVVVTAKDIKHLPERVAAAAGTMLRSIGVSPDDIESELSEMAVGQLGTTASRRVLGSLNDVVFHFQHGTGRQQELSLHERALRMARMPWAALEYVFPAEATLAAFAAAGTLKSAKRAA
jgi:hypothetical protein